MAYLTPADLEELVSRTGLAPADEDALTAALADAADPLTALSALTGLAAAAPGPTGRALARDRPRRALVAVLGTSRSLGRWLASRPDALGFLDGASDAPLALAGRQALVEHALDAVGGAARPEGALRTFKRERLLELAAADLLGETALPVVAAALADLADACLEAAVVLADAPGLAVVGMGKLGGNELNYSSDVDVLFVSPDGDVRGARRVIEIMAEPLPEGIVWRVDADLRPEGRAGPLTRTPESYLAYYRRWADAWEFQALIKRRPVAGDHELGADLCAALEELVYPAAWPADTLASLRAMKARAEAQLSRTGLAEREVKLGPGGIRDVEFAVQLLQLVHGHGDPDIRSPNTLAALERLAENGYVDPVDADTLADSYATLRTVEHRLQLRDEAQVHALPADPGELEFLARGLGYRPDAHAPAAEHFLADFGRNVATVRGVHERLFYRPLLEAFTAEDERAHISAEAAEDERAHISAEAAEDRLHAFGFANAARTRAALGGLTSGLSRRSRLMTRMLPLLLGWLTDAPDPDLGLLMLERLTERPHRAETLTTLFRDSPLAAQRLCRVLGTSRPLGETLEHEPDLVGMLAEDRLLGAPRSREELQHEAESRLAWRQNAPERRRALRNFANRERSRVGIRDLLGFADTEDTGRELTRLAETCLEAALRTSGVDPLRLPPVAVVGLGRLGGAELSYRSDLDVVIVYADGGDFAPVERLAESLIDTLSAPSPEGRAFELDLDLRPEGKQGVLARSLETYVSYWERWADTWEFQALTRARPVAGDPDLGAAFMEAAAPFVYRDPMPAQWALDIRRMKARIERERLPKRSDPARHMKLGRGGLVDVEFAVQYLQLLHGAAHPEVRRPRLPDALDALGAAGLLDADTAGRLGEAYAFACGVRNRLALLGVRDPDVLPDDVDTLGRLARSLGYEHHPAPTLREEYRRLTRRARRAAEAVLFPE